MELVVDRVLSETCAPPNLYPSVLQRMGSAVSSPAGSGEEPQLPKILVNFGQKKHFVLYIITNLLTIF